MVLQIYENSGRQTSACTISFVVSSGSLGELGIRLPTWRYLAKWGIRLPHYGMIPTFALCGFVWCVLRCVRGKGGAIVHLSPETLLYAILRVNSVLRYNFVLGVIVIRIQTRNTDVYCFLFRIVANS